MHFDELLVTVGDFGPYQRRLYFLLSLPSVQNAAVGMLLVVFLFDVPQHRCSIPGLRNDSYAVQDAAHADLINRTIPRGHGDLKFSSCDVYSSSNWTDDGSGDHINITKTCHEWVYDRTVYDSTVVQAMDLVCDRKRYVTHAKMMGMLGQLVAVFISGPLSDMFGRRTMMLVAMFSAVFFSICLNWVTNFYLLLACVFIVIGTLSAQFLSCFIYSMEIVGPSKRMITGVAMNLFWSAGNMILALVAFLVRDWKTRQLAISIPGIIFVYLYFLPESPRWQITKCRNKAAKTTMLKIAKCNKVEIPDATLDNVICNDEESERFWELFRSPIMLKRMVVICCNWLAIGMGFFGLSMNVTNLSGNVYLNYFLFSVVEACSYALCTLFISRIGRRKLLCATMLMAGAACFSTFIPFFVTKTPNTWIITVLACLGNSSVSASFAIVYVFTVELLPTTTRNFGTGLCSVFCRVGSISSPYINDLTMHISGRYSQILPMLIFGSMTTLAGLLCLLLPETFNKRLPETIQEAEKLGTMAYGEANTDPDITLLAEKEDHDTCL
ncbi:organic cation transporter protein-like isoform X2 [Haliotis rufescens]|uniref:organic cation transporter protein-like isoform X2 n=1 Tax=Haliotis rufescens TaxID=6454 RepID=UPI00201ED881|nr:organic cation transporter protein-like isoform X2 [Haliotis rufescens]